MEFLILDFEGYSIVHPILFTIQFLFNFRSISIHLNGNSMKIHQDWKKSNESTKYILQKFPSNSTSKFTSKYSLLPLKTWHEHVYSKVTNYAWHLSILKTKKFLYVPLHSRKNANIFLIFSPQILRNHVMVRVGGGWDTLQHYLDKHDPCRCRAGKINNRVIQYSIIQKSYLIPVLK